MCNYYYYYYLRHGLKLTPLKEISLKVYVAVACCEVKTLKRVSLAEKRAVSLLSGCTLYAKSIKIYGGICGRLFITK